MHLNLKKTKQKILNEYIVDRHEFLLCTFIAKIVCFVFVEFEKCGFVRNLNARRFTNEDTFYQISLKLMFKKCGSRTTSFS